MRQGEVPADLQSVEGAPTLGQPASPLVLIVFSDFQCPFCGQFATETLPALRTDYVDSGKVQVVFRNLPLVTHARARRAAEAGECAARQSKFWPMHDVMFKNADRLTDSDLLAYANEVGVDAKAFELCMNGLAPTSVRTDSTLASELGVTSTPTFLFGRRQSDGRVRVLEVTSGVIPIRDFRRTLDRLLRH